ncbi:MAG: GNAT family N-acetyltransferase, partial [Xanthomarina sp.]
MRYRIKRFTRSLQPELIRELFYEHDLKTLPKIESKLPVVLKTLDKNNISRINDVKKLPLGTLKTRLDNGDICFVTEKSGCLLSYHWVQTQGKHYVQQTAKWEQLENGDAVIYHVRVHTDFRGNRINGFVYSEILQHCKDHGFKRVWIYTNKNNVSNRKGLEELGFIEYKETLSLKLNRRYFLL